MDRRAPPLVAVAALGLLAFASCSEAPTVPELGSDPVVAFAKGGRRSGGPVPTGRTIEQLGSWLFEDPALSLNGNQSCRTCHEPSMGFAAPLPGVVTLGSVVQGSQPGQFGDRKPPSAAYATLAPNFAYSGNNAMGGNFWDGRATGALLGNPAMDQALGPYLNPKEQALPDEACLIWRLTVDTEHAYLTSFLDLWQVDLAAIAFPDDVATVCTTFTTGPGPLVQLSAADRALVHEQYLNVGRAVAAFENTFNTFDSRADLGALTALEAEGEKIFGGKGKCQQCHDNKGSQPLYTDFEFHNLGVPRNAANPVYGDPGTFDPGLGARTGNSAHVGKFKTPTVRNVGLGDRTFMHNGALVDLRQVVQFYNTRDVLPVCSPVPTDPTRWGPDGDGCWPPPEYPDNLDTQNMGNLGLSSHEVDAIVAFMMALSNGGS